MFEIPTSVDCPPFRWQSLEYLGASISLGVQICARSRYQRLTKRVHPSEPRENLVRAYAPKVYQLCNECVPADVSAYDVPSRSN